MVSVTVIVSSLQVSGVYEGIVKAQGASHKGTGVIQEGVEVAKKRAVEAGAAPESCQVYTIFPINQRLPHSAAVLLFTC